MQKQKNEVVSSTLLDSSVVLGIALLLKIGEQGKREVKDSVLKSDCKLLIDKLNNSLNGISKDNLA